VNHTIKK